MSRKAVALHVVEKARKTKQNLRQIASTTGQWETGDWKVSDATAASLVSGSIFVHRGQKVPSHIGGRVISYRDVDGGRKVFLFRAIKTMKGVMAGSAGWGNEKKVVWESAVGNLKHIPPDDDESAFPEGADRYRLHRSNERDPKLAARAKRKRLTETGVLKCDACDFDFSVEYGQLGDGFIEAHHTVPVATLDGTRKTKLLELALVCSNCHRMLHRASPPLTIDELRELMNGEV
jgi:hypothetical protein